MRRRRFRQAKQITDRRIEGFIARDVHREREREQEREREREAEGEGDRERERA